MDYLVQAFGVFLGVIAGASVIVLAALVLERRKETQQVRNLRFELELNAGKVDEWLEEINRYRNAVNGDALDTYSGYFDLSRMISVTANSMLQTGVLYKKLTHDQIRQLQMFFSEMFVEQYMNNQLTQSRQAFEQCRSENRMETWTTSLKPEAVSHVDFWERKFQDHRKALGQIIKSLRS